MLSDLRYAFRQLARAPGFSAVVMITLAICIGANSAIFSLIDAILLKPYPWPDSDRLVYVYNSYPLIGLENAGTAIPDYLDRSKGVAAFADSALYHRANFNLAASGDQPERIVGIYATASLFSTLQTAPAIGRVFTEEDAQPGHSAVVVISDALWKNRFARDKAIVGKTIRLDAAPVTVIGVMPDGFYFPQPRVQAWVPFPFTAAQRSDSERGTEFSTMIARLKPGASPATIRRDLDTIQTRNAERVSNMRQFWKTSGFGGRTVGFLEQNVGDVRGMLWLVQAGAAVALLIGCANIGGLLLARAVARERELAIRSALGAGRRQLIRLLLTESLLLFMLGGALGLVVALWGVSALASAGLSALPRAESVDLDFGVFAFTVLCSAITGLVFGALPAFAASRADPSSALCGAGTRTTSTRRTQRLRASLVVVEIALAIMLLSTAALLVKSFARLQQQSPGFSPEGVITASLDLPTLKYDRPEKQVAFHDTVIANVKSIPGVTAVGMTTMLPFSGNYRGGTYSSPDIIVSPGTPEPHAQILEVDTGYLRAIGLTLLQGRWFVDSDREGATSVCVVDRILVDRYWPGQNGIGKRIGFNDKLWQIVGVVSSVKVRNLEQSLEKESIYFPYAQSPDTSVTLVVRSSLALAPLAIPVREAVLRADSEQPIFDVQSMMQRMDEAAQPRRVPMLLLSLFSGVALFLAALGIYGVLAFSVARRTSEFGIRVALGATRRNIAGIVLQQGVWLIVIGFSSGLAGYLALSRIITKLVYGIDAADPATLIVAPAILGLCALLACVLPIRRATRIDPMVAMRTE
jgi:putative ABC transport system permease protein